MNFIEYINQQKDQFPTQETKHSTYQKILWNINRSERNTNKKYNAFFYTKIWVSLLFVAWLWYFLYGITPYTIPQQWVSVMKTTSNIAMADSIATIISFDWNYSIYHNDILTNWLYIYDGDIVSMDAWSKIKFDINDSTYAEVYGPAKFIISKDSENKYTIDLKDSQYFQIFNKNTSSNIISKILSDSTDTTIITPKYKLQGKDMDIIIAKKSNDELIVKNNWNNITITDSDLASVKITNKQIAKLNGNIDVLTEDMIDDTPVLLSKLSAPDIDINNIISWYINSWSKQSNELSDSSKSKTDIYIAKVKYTKEASNTWNISSSWDKQQTWDTNTWNNLDLQLVMTIKPVLGYKNITSHFDIIAQKMNQFDGSYLQNVYSIWEDLAVAHTKLWLPVNYYPNIYYIKYMANNLKSYLVNFDNIPNDYIYSLDYIITQMDVLNEKKLWDHFENNYQLVSEVIPQSKSQSKKESNVFVSWAAKMMTTSNSATKISTSGDYWIKPKDIQIINMQIVDNPWKTEWINIIDNSIQNNLNNDEKNI